MILYHLPDRLQLLTYKCCERSNELTFEGYGGVFARGSFVIVLHQVAARELAIFADYVMNVSV
jgi:hypothetical protein